MPEKSKKTYSEEKARRIAAAATVAGVLLAMFLIVLLTIQFVQIGVRRAERARLDDQIAAWEQITDKQEKQLKDWKDGDALYYEALKQGWRNP